MEIVARQIQDLHLDGNRQEAATPVPDELLNRLRPIGSDEHVAQRLAAFRRAGVTTLMVDPVGPDPVGTMASLREIVDSA